MLKRLTTALAFFLAAANAALPQTRDLMADTWVGVDALGRTMPTSDSVGLTKTDRQRAVGIFYVTWHDESLYNSPSPYRNVSETLDQNQDARLTDKTGLWSNASNMGSYHWGEPESGYFLSCDKYVIRRDMSMLADAGVDVLILDVTNAVCYWQQWDTLFTVMEEMKREGSAVPQICFWVYNGAAVTVAQNVYERYYKKGLYHDLWYHLDGKPLLLCNMRPELDANGGGAANPNPNYDERAASDPTHAHYGDPDYTERFYHGYTKEVRDFFTMRNMWWGYYTWGGERYAGTEDNWSFGYEMNDKRIAALSPSERAATHKGRCEEMAVTPAQHPISMTGKSWRAETGEPKLDERDLPETAVVPWLGKAVDDPEGYGIYFQDRWDEALSVDPDFIYLNDWNEWTAGKYPTGKAPGSDLPGPNAFLGRKGNSFYFVDQYNSEFNRTIQPVKGLYTDNYYMQMAQNIRRYKGVRPIPVNHGMKDIDIDGRFDDWAEVPSYYLDTRGDTYHRSHNGYAGLHYTDTTGRNDITESKVAVGKESLFFYVKTDSAMSPYDGHNWMLLLMDADNDPATGWHGYDYVVNKRVADDRTTTLMRYDTLAGRWTEVCRLPYRVCGAELELRVPRTAVSLTQREMTFDFKWADNPRALDDIISICTDGDTAPNRRFNYRFIWSQPKRSKGSPAREKPSDGGFEAARRNVSLPRTIFSGWQNNLHAQGVAVDQRRGFAYFSFTTRLIKTDLQGRLIGSVEGITGHLGSITIDKESGKLYASLEYKNDSIGLFVLDRIGKRGGGNAQEGFYVAIFDTEKISRPNMDAAKDGVMRTVWLQDVADDYRLTAIQDGDTLRHKHGCSGIDGITLAPSPRHHGETRLLVAYGVYSDTTRTDNDYQVLLEYDVSGWQSIAKPLRRDSMHTSGPQRADERYFVYTGNTKYGIQSMAYDEDSRQLLIATYEGGKKAFPNYTLFAVDLSGAPKRRLLKGVKPEQNGLTLPLARRKDKDGKEKAAGWRYGQGQTGLCAMGGGLFYVSERMTDRQGNEAARLHLKRLSEAGDSPFEDVR